MSEIMFKDKIKLVTDLVKLRDSIWGLQRKLRLFENDETNKFVKKINEYCNKYEKILIISNEYDRFNNLTQTNKYDNFISIIKIIRRLDLNSHIEVDLKSDFDFDNMWEIINEDESISISKDEYDSVYDFIHNVALTLIDINYNEHIEYVTYINNRFGL